MPERKTMKRAQKAKSEGKAPSTQAGEFVREEFDHIRQGKHGAKSAKQAVAIGLSKARSSGVKIPKVKGGKTTAAPSKMSKKMTSSTRSKAATAKLKDESQAAGSTRAISRQARDAAKKRTAADKHASAMKAVKTKGKVGLKKAAQKAAATKKRHQRTA